MQRSKKDRGHKGLRRAEDKEAQEGRRGLRKTSALTPVDLKICC